jgi:hypothetical protein
MSGEHRDTSEHQLRFWRGGQRNDFLIATLWAEG